MNFDRYSVDKNSYAVGVFEKKTKHQATDKEQLLPQSFSLDDTQGSEQKEKQRKNEESKSRPKSVAATKEDSNILSSKPRPASVPESKNKVSVYSFNNCWCTFLKCFTSCGLVVCIHVMVVCMSSYDMLITWPVVPPTCTSRTLDTM